MYSVGARANAVFAYTMFVLFGLLGVNIVSRLVLPSDPRVEIKINKADKLYVFRIPS